MSIVCDPKHNNNTPRFYELPRDSQIQVFSYLNLQEMFATIGNHEARLLGMGNRLVQTVESNGLIPSAVKAQIEFRLSRKFGALNEQLDTLRAKMGIVLAPNTVRSIKVDLWHRHLNRKLTSEKCKELLQSYPMIQSLTLDLDQSALLCLPHLPQLHHLQTLGITGCQVTDNMLDSLQGLPLQDLTIQCKNLPSLAKLAIFPHLTDLTLYGRVVTNNDLIELRKLPHLRSLGFCGCFIDSNNTDLSLLANSGTSSIEELSFYYNIELTDNQLSQLKALSLKRLVIFDNGAITDDGLSHLKDTAIQELTFQECLGITQNGLTHINALPLTKLTLMYCPKIQSLNPLQNLRLQQLHISDLPISDDSLRDISEMPLHALSLMNCEQITDEGLLNHLNGTSLLQLQINGTPITQECAAKLRKKFPNLVVKTIL